MQQVIVTGLNGRLAPFLKATLNSYGVTTVAFDRNVLDINNAEQQKTFFIENNIDGIFHLATGAESWVATLATLAFELDIPFLFTSTESVFNPDSTGPFTPDIKPDAVNDYGRYKIACEQAALSANMNTIIVRLGWQMFNTFDKDNLLTHVRDMHNEKGYLEASNNWLPAVSYVEDTMQCLYQLMQLNEPGIYHVGGNEDGFSFYDLVNLINKKYALGWDIRPGKLPNRDGRIMDARVECNSIINALV